MSDLSPECAPKQTSVDRSKFICMVHALVVIAIDPTICHIARRGITMPPASISLHLPAHQSMIRTRSSQ